MQALRNVFPTCIGLFRGFVPASEAVTSRPALLAPNSTNLLQRCGMKVKGVLKLRCKDCYKVWRDERLYIMCKSFGRHKQMQMKKKPKTTWILTHATQGRLRPW